MRLALFTVLAILMATAPAGAQSPQGDAGAVRVDKDVDTGDIVATTKGWKPVKEKYGYSIAAAQELILWVEAAKAMDGTKRVRLVGEKARYLFPREAGGTHSYGPSDPDDPAYVGSPFAPADMRYRGVEVECTDDSHYCAKVWLLDIVVPAATLDAFMRNPKAKEL